MATAEARGPVNVSISYAHRDETLVRELESHLKLLERKGVLDTWRDRKIVGGERWDEAIARELEESNLLLLLLSADFLASDYIYSVEMKAALERAASGKARVIPIILRPVSWQGTPLASLQALPRDAKPVTSWRNRDEAWVDVVAGIELICRELAAPARSQGSPRVTAQTTHPLFEVFKASGMPTITFVEPDAFPQLKMSIAQAGRGVVIQGPSGIGKTTALRQAVAEALPARRAGQFQLLSARRNEEVKRIETIERWHNGVVAIDDFHRLEKPLQQHIADYLKDLADRELEDRKLIIVGIPRTGQRLVDLAFDLATRIDVYRLGRVRDETVIRMIEIGETALNIQFDRRADIARAASGSLNIAQLLCFQLAAAAGVLGTQPKRTVIRSEVRSAVATVLEQISLKFGEMIRTFAALGDRRDTTAIEILQQLARAEEGFLSLPRLRDARPELAGGITRFLKNGYIDMLYEKVPSSQQHLLFDSNGPALVIDDPQLTFFLVETPITKLMAAAGKADARARSNIFISYSHSDAEWLARIRVHLKPLEREGLIDLWDDTRISAGTVWRDEIAKAIDRAKIALLLISADFLASDFVAEKELPPLLTAASKDGLRVIPVIVSPSRYEREPELSKFQAANPPSTPLASLTREKQEELFAGLAETIEDLLSA